MTSMIRTAPLTSALWLALAACAHAAPADAAVGAADTASAATPRDFERLQVTATRTQRAIVEVLSSVDVIDREQMDRELV